MRLCSDQIQLDFTQEAKYYNVVKSSKDSPCKDTASILRTSPFILLISLLPAKSRVRCRGSVVRYVTLER